MTRLNGLKISRPVNRRNGYKVLREISLSPEGAR